MVETDKIAIVLATYQGDKYIREQLESLVRQTYTDWICFIHDDGSDDKTVSILKEFESVYPDKFVIMQGEACGGAKENFCYLLSRLDAPYVMCCDQDDVWETDKIEQTISVMKREEKKHPILVFTDLRIVDEDQKEISKSMAEWQQLNCNKLEAKDIAIQNVVTGCTMMINRSLLRLFQQSLDTVKIDKMIMHDWWCALIASRFGKVVYIPKATIKYRQHRNNSVGAKNVTAFSYVVKKMVSISEMKKSLELTRTQAGEFCKVFGISGCDVLFRYSQIHKYPKIEREIFFIKNKMNKSGIYRNIAFRILR